MTEPQGQPSARVERSHWPGWIWLLPLGVLGFLLWLGMRAWLFGGEKVTVAFSTSHGITSGTSVDFRGVKVGTVDEVRLSDDRRLVLMDLTMQPEITNLLREGTRFWVAIPDPMLGQIKELISGPHIAMDPGPGERAGFFKGLDRPPVLRRHDDGRHFTLFTEEPGLLSVGSPVRYLDVPVGEVRGVRLAAVEGRVEVTIFVRDQHADLIRESTEFWRAGGMAVDTSGRLAIDMPSWTTLTKGAVDFTTPAKLAGAQVDDGHVFPLHDSRQSALASPGGPRFAYVARFAEPVGGLSPGAAVLLEGVEVGRVARTRLTYDPDSGALGSEVFVSIEPEWFGIEIAVNDSRDEVRHALDDALQTLVRQGLRARPSGGLLPGSSSISLARVSQAGDAELDVEHMPPVLPTAPGGGGLGQAVDSLARVANAADDLPLSAIASHLRSTVRKMDALLHDPAINRSVRHLRATLAHAESVARVADQNAGPLTASLRRTAEETQMVARRANRLIGGTVRQNQDVAELVKELTDAAAAVDHLASYLSRHPEALVTGRDD